MFGIGSPSPRVVFIGEAPGEQEDMSGTPFVGKAGERLRKTLKNLGFDQHDVYLTNTVMCRPADNRDPKKDEYGVCMERLREQLRILDPFVVVGLGRIAAQALHRTTQGITDLRGRMVRFPMKVGEIQWSFGVFLTFHPSYINRNPAEQKGWEKDLQQVLKIITQMKGTLQCQ